MRNVKPDMSDKEPGTTQRRRAPGGASEGGELAGELKEVVARLERETESLLRRDFPREEWTGTQFFKAIKRTCKEIRQENEPPASIAALLPPSPPGHLSLEELVSHLEAERVSLHRQARVLEIVRDQLWEILMQNRKELDRAQSERAELLRALKFYADEANWKPGGAVSRAASDGGQLARTTLAKADPKASKRQW